MTFKKKRQSACEILKDWASQLGEQLDYLQWSAAFFVTTFYVNIDFIAEFV